MTSWNDREQKLAVAKAARAYGRGALSRRDFLRICAQAGIGFSSIGLLQACSKAPQTTSPAPGAAEVAASAGPLSASKSTSDAAKFLKDAGRPFKGTTLRVLTESTPPSRAIREIMKQEFMPLTGINVEWEESPLDQVLAKVSQDAAGGLGANDLYYLDQAWLGRFAHDTLDPTELIATKKDLAFPNYNFDDFLKPLVDHIGSYKGRVVGLPFDIPIFIMMYRKDVFDQLKLQPPKTMPEYLNAVKTIHEAKIKNKDGSTIAGTVGQWKSGHYALQCDMTAWLWSHGGSHFNAEGKSTINDDKALAGLEYMMKLGQYMPSGATNYDWAGQGNAFAQGQAGLMISCSESFPDFDMPNKSKVVGLVQPAACPKEVALRSPGQCGFDETPGISHQGGSCLALSKYSKNVDAAWLFMQWATSADIQARATLLGGGVTPMRESTFGDPRIREKHKITTGTTRHFDITMDAIKNRMGTEPHLSTWAEISVNVTAAELGKMTTGKQDIKTTAANMAKGLDEGAKQAKKDAAERQKK